jgi:hypothetical protein
MIMKRIFARSLCLALLLAVTVCAVGYGQISTRGSEGSQQGPISLSYFYDSLSPYGQWFHDSSYGWVWTPYDVSEDWRPYSDGHWEYSDYGWSWASNEAWGWAPYHYGRWFFDDSYGWAWVPGTEWAPAWVAWRYGDDYVGWAPLPPTANWDASAGLVYGDANSIPSHEWSFVPQPHVFDVALHLQVTSVARNVTLLSRSHDATRFEVRNGRPANIGPDIGQVENHFGRTVPRMRIVDVNAPKNGRGQAAGRGGIGFFRPTVQATPPGQAPAPPVIQRGNAIPPDMMQRQRDQQQRKVESDLKTEQARLARDQQNELRTRGQGPAADEIRKQHAAEQQAFDAHAVQQRRVMDQRIQNQIIRPGSVKSPGQATSNAKGRGRGKAGR